MPLPEDVMWEMIALSLLNTFALFTLIPLPGVPNSGGGPIKRADARLRWFYREVDDLPAALGTTFGLLLVGLLCVFVQALAWGSLYLIVRALQCQGFALVALAIVALFYGAARLALGRYGGERW